MRRILIFGNTASGKSTQARRLASKHHLAHLDLDTLAWLPAQAPEVPPQRAPIAESRKQIDRFTAAHAAWLIEGCYSDLLEIALFNRFSGRKTLITGRKGA